jgi:hypothetical protein
VVLAIPIEFSGNDSNGIRFSEWCHTEMVSLHGASVVLSRRVSTDRPITVRRRTPETEAHGRILGQLGIRTGAHVYGIAFTEDNPNFWGIFFPPFATTNAALARTLLRCSKCGTKIIFTFNEIEFRVYEANQRITGDCETCGRTLWIPVPNGTGDNQSGPAESGPQDRKYARVSMKTTACIQDPSGGEDVVQVLDVSRGGVSFRGDRVYEVNTWIQIAVPYTPGAANIFVAGRIARRQELDNGQKEYGVQYVKG